MEVDGGNKGEAGRRAGMGRGNVYDQESGHRLGEVPASKPLCVVRALGLLSRPSDVDWLLITGLQEKTPIYKRIDTLRHLWSHMWWHTQGPEWCWSWRLEADLCRESFDFHLILTDSFFLSDLVVALGLRCSSTTCSISYLWFDMRCQIKRVIRREFFSFSFLIDLSNLKNNATGSEGSQKFPWFLPSERRLFAFMFWYP